MKEIWKEIKDYEGLYWVSNQGRVKNRHNRILKPEIRTGYHSVGLCKNSKCKHYRIHRLVAQAFIPNPENKPIINHIDENKLNNTPSNLEWCTNQENIDAYAKNHPNINFSAQPVYCLDLDKYFESASDATVHTGACRTSIVKCCRGQLQQAGGMLWCYSKDKDKKFPPK